MGDRSGWVLSTVQPVAATKIKRASGYEVTPPFIRSRRAVSVAW